MQTNDLLALVTIVSAVVILMLKLCFASKCGKISLCFGLINVDREVQLENREFQSVSTTPSNISDNLVINHKNDEKSIDQV